MLKNVLTKFTKKDIIGDILLVVNGCGCITLINYGDFYGKYNLLLFGVVTMWLLNMVFCLLDLRKRIIGFIFHLAIFLFLLTRTIIPFLQGIDWWTYYSPSANSFALRAISYSLIAITGGIGLFEAIIKICDKNEPKQINECLLKIVRIVLIICMVCYFFREIDKLLFMRGRAYEEYYSAYQYRLPVCFNLPAECMPYILCMFLALKPTKLESFVWLGINILSSFPMLKIGVRNVFILNCLFAFVYYFLRDIIREKDEKKWIGKLEKGMIICVVPILVVFLGAYNYIRDGKDVNMSATNLIIDFAYKQGTTYDTVLQGYTFREKLPWNENKIYTFGAITDSMYTSVGRKIFRLEDIGSGNCLKAVFNGHSFAHAISYVVMGENYIAGEGRGSSYIIENYLDWGYPGVILFSIMLGFLCAAIPQYFGGKWLVSVICLNITSNLFFLPRASSMAFAMFLVSYKFWACIIGCLLLAKIWEILIKKRVWKKM